MNKLIIPAIALSLILVAIGLAIQAVERASAIHTSIGTLQVVTKTDTDFDVGDSLSFTCTGAATIQAIAMDNAGTLAATDNWDLVVDVDGAGTTFTAATFNDIFGGFAPEDEYNVLTLTGDPQIGIGAGGTVSIVAAAEAADNNNEVVAARFVAQGTGCS